MHTSISPKKTKKRPVETTVEVFIFFFSVFSIFVIGFYIYIAATSQNMLNVLQSFRMITKKN